jgi:hypothetical protein
MEDTAKDGVAAGGPTADGHAPAMDVAIVHYNTPELTAACIKSVRRNTPGCRFTVFDNSDKRPFVPMEGVEVIDNTRGQIINFKAMICRYPDRVETCNGHASSKHIASVDKLFDYLPDGFVLLDSDVLIYRDIAGFFDRSKAWVGHIEQRPQLWFQAPRLYPFLLWINVPMLRVCGIRFWHEGYSYKLSHQGAPPFYDTGASLLRDCRLAGLPTREENIFDYLIHYGGASYSKTPDDVFLWLRNHRHLYL